MPITVQPVPSAPGGANCADQGVIRPTIPTVEGFTSPQRQLGIQLTQTQAAVVEWTFRDPLGRALDLASCLCLTPDLTSTSNSSSNSSSASSGVSSSQALENCGEIRVRLREALACSPDAFWAVAGTVHESGSGKVRFTIPTAAVAEPGVLRMDFGLFQNDILIVASTGFAVIERSLFAQEYRHQGCPTVAEIRTHLRDSGPEDNYLLGVVEYELGEIASAMVWAVDLWNTSKPPVGPRYSTANFPEPSVLLDGIIGKLYKVAAHNYRRNHLTYSAAGLSVDDKNKFQEYENLGEQLLQKFQRWVTMSKVDINRRGWAGAASGGIPRRTW